MSRGEEMARRLNALTWSRLLEKQSSSKIPNVYARAAERSVCAQNVSGMTSETAL